MKQVRERQKEIQMAKEEKRPRHVFELWEHIGRARAKRIKERGRAVRDSMLAVYKNCVTYTFILDQEVASIHYDRLRGEIFFKGHNINNMKLTARQIQALMDLKMVLNRDEKGHSFLSDYDATLDKLLADKR